MGFHISESQFDTWLTQQQKTYHIYAPIWYAGGNTFSDVDCIRYDIVNKIADIVFDKKSEYSFKEVLTPISQTLFFFTEDQCKKSALPKKELSFFFAAAIFMRWND